MNTIIALFKDTSLVIIIGLFDLFSSVQQATVDVNRCLLHAAKEIEQSDDDYQAGIFEEGDDGVHQPRDNQLERLREDDQPLCFPIAECE